MFVLDLDPQLPIELYYFISHRIHSHFMVDLFDSFIT